MNVQLDDELQAWVRDIHENGLRAVGAEKGGKGGKGEEGDKGVPTEFRDIAELTEFVTTIIFTASCQNAALTSGMMDYYAFCPNAPTMMLVAPPTVKGCTTMEVVRAAMPSRGKTAEVVAACYTLSRLNKDQVSCPGELSRWAVRVSCPGGLSGLAVRVGCPGWLSGLAVQVCCPGGLSRCPVRVGCPGELSRWAVRVGCPGELSRWAVRVGCPGWLSGLAVQVCCPGGLSG